MRIISKFQDYYDGAQGYGIDPDLLFIRHTEEHLGQAHWRQKEKKATRYDEIVGSYSDLVDRVPYNHRYNEVMSVDTAYLMFFCGKLYVGLSVSYPSQKKHAWSYEKEHQILWDIDAVEKLFEKYREKYSCAEDFLVGDARDRWDGRIRYSLNGFRQMIDEYSQTPESDILDLHIRSKSPIVLFKVNGRNSEAIINPVLKNLDFMKVKDPYTAFQELSMYIGGVMGSLGNDMVEISDDVRVAKHGFDTEYGFRTRPK